MFLHKALHIRPEGVQALDRLQIQRVFLLIHPCGVCSRQNAARAPAHMRRGVRSVFIIAERRRDRHAAAERAGLVRGNGLDRHVHHIRKHLRPHLRARCTPGETDRAAPVGARAHQAVEMVPVRERDALVYRAGHFPPRVRGVQPDERRAGARVHVARRQKRQEYRHKVAGRERIDPVVQDVVNALSRRLRLGLELRQEPVDEPLIIARRGGARFLDEVVSRQAEERIHKHGAGIR